MNVHQDPKLSARKMGRRHEFVVGVTVLVAFLCLAESYAEELATLEQDGITTIRHHDRLLLEYHSQPHPTKPYVSRWYTPKGVQILRDSPHDHVHHHALMYALGINGVDFWSEVPASQFGRQVPKGPTITSAFTQDCRGQASIKQTILWTDPAEVQLATESRTITAHVGVVPDASLLTWEFSLEPSERLPSIELGGWHFFGLGMRFVPSMDKGGQFAHAGTSQGVPVRGSEELTRATWCGFAANADGKPVTVAMFDHSENPRHPATWFTMNTPFAYLTATLGLKDQPLVVTKGKPLEVKYGIAAWDGKVDRATIENAYQQWLELD